MKIQVYGKQNCPWCVKATELLTSKGLRFTYTDVLKDMSVGELVNLKTLYDMNTVPIIVINDKLIGGYTDLVKLDL